MAEATVHEKSTNATSCETKKREDLETDIAETHELFLANEHLVKMKESWDMDKARMLDFQMKLCKSQIAMKNLNDKLPVSEAQLALSRSLNNQPKVSVEPTSTLVQAPPPFQLPVPVHNNDIHGKENVESLQIERKPRRIQP